VSESTRAENAAWPRTRRRELLAGAVGDAARSAQRGEFEGPAKRFTGFAALAVSAETASELHQGSREFVGRAVALDQPVEAVNRRVRIALGVVRRRAPPTERDQREGRAAGQQPGALVRIGALDHGLEQLAGDAKRHLAFELTRASRPHAHGSLRRQVDRLTEQARLSDSGVGWLPTANGRAPVRRSAN